MTVKKVLGLVFALVLLAGYLPSGQNQLKDGVPTGCGTVLCKP